MFKQPEWTTPGKAWRGATAALAAGFCGLAADPQPAPAATPPAHPEVKPPSFKQSFAAWQREFWTDAAAFGISHATFAAAFKGVEPDTRLPDLVRRGPKKRPKGQAEFTRPPQAYVSEKTIARLAAEGRRLARTYAATLARIERRFGVPSNVVLAIWGRETAYGRYRVRHDAIRALATQAYMGRRHGMFRAELLAALRMLQDGVIARDKLKASWAGAVGLTQFMPSEYGKLAVDLDGDGHKNIWDVPDALASAANQLAKKGWVRGQTWGYEIETGGYEIETGRHEIEGGRVTCAEDGPLNRRALREWEARGVRRVAGRRFSDAHRRQSVFLFSPGGGLGPQFLATENFLVFKRYNMSDLYALFVGHLADRIAGGGKFVRGWGAIKQLPRRQIAAIQSILKKEAYAIGKIDGRIGPMTRSQIGQYQLRHKAAGGGPIDCWPTARLLGEMQERQATASR